MRRSSHVLLLWTLCLLSLCNPCLGAIEPARLYFGIREAVTVRATDHTESTIQIAMLDGQTRRELARRELRPNAHGEIDLSDAFAQIFSGIGQQRVVYAQAYRNNTPVGAPIVIEPMVSPRTAVNARTAAILDAFERGDAQTLERLKTMTQEQAETLAGQVVWRDPPVRVCAGFRVYTDRVVQLETSLGSMTIALRPDSAPNTCFEFLELVEGGFYTNVPFHRIVPADKYGRPFVVQAGDPGATGDGTPGFSLDFEPSNLPHDLGVVSMARELDDPNSNGSQFFICLSREGCARLDGRFVAFAELTHGAETLAALAAAPVGLRNPEDPSSAMDRPLDPPMILGARTIDAPPITDRPERIRVEQVPGVER